MNYIIFEKKSENDRPIWTESLVKEFCEEQKLEPLGIVEEQQFFVVKLTEPTEHNFRLLEVTPTITFILKDDPSLDEIMELETSLPPC
jgi:hypothetical protein